MFTTVCRHARRFVGVCVLCVEPVLHALGLPHPELGDTARYVAAQLLAGE